MKRPIIKACIFLSLIILPIGYLYKNLTLKNTPTISKTATTAVDPTLNKTHSTEPSSTTSKTDSTPNTVSSASNENKNNSKPSPKIANKNNHVSPKITQKKDKPTSKGIEYKDEKLGFSLKFPENWRNKYIVKETKDGMYVYFKPEKTKENDTLGFLFGIVNKSSKGFSEDTFDTVCNKRYFKVKDVTYVIGGPTDIGFPDNHPEYPTFDNLRKDIPKIIETLR